MGGARRVIRGAWCWWLSRRWSVKGVGKCIVRRVCRSGCVLGGVSCFLLFSLPCMCGGVRCRLAG